jgi:hypothetical protein
LFVWQTANCLLILRVCCKFLTERLTETEFIRVFNKNVLTVDGDVESTGDCEPTFANTAQEFVSALVDILMKVPVK